MSAKFRQILAAAVERKGESCQVDRQLMQVSNSALHFADFTHDQLPPQAWSKDYVSARVNCNDTQIVHYALSYDWKARKADSFHGQTPVRAGCDGYSPSGVGGFTQFRPHDEVVPASSALQLEGEGVASAAGPDGLGNVELLNLQQGFDRTNLGDVALHQPVVLERALCQNVLGAVPDASEPLALAIVDAVSATSKAGTFQHAPALMRTLADFASS